jgi:hypothetical protein
MRKADPLKEFQANREMFFRAHVTNILVVLRTYVGANHPGRLWPLQQLEQLGLNETEAAKVVKGVPLAHVVPSPKPYVLLRECRPEIEPEVFWVHVDGNGSEHLFAHEPHPHHPPAFRVERFHDDDGGLIEQACTRNRIEHHGPMYTYVPVKPRGEGWALFDASRDKATVWRRSAREHSHADG